MSTDRNSIDFDQHSKEFCGPVAERIASWRQVRERCPVAWSPNYGGFWILTDYPSVSLASRDAATFAHLYRAERGDDGIEYIGELGLPRPGYVGKLGLGEADGQSHRDLRRALNPKFSPPAVKAFEPMIRHVASWFLDQRIASGSIDLIDDFIGPVTSVATLEMMGLPTDLWQETCDVFHGSLGFAPDSAEFSEMVNERGPALLAEFLGVAKMRRTKPRDDVVSTVATVVVEGEPLSDEDMTLVLWNLVSGGVDTTLALTSRALVDLYLDRNLRRQLVEAPELLDAAIEEFLRLYPSVQWLTRTVTKDVVVQEQQVQRGDHVLISHAAANRDPSEFSDPDQFVLDRPHNRHLSFGLGPHRCIGAHVARLTIKVLLSEVLERIPDYAVDMGSVRERQNGSLNLGIWNLPTTFTPRPPRHVPNPIG